MIIARIVPIFMIVKPFSLILPYLHELDFTGWNKYKKSHKCLLVSEWEKTMTETSESLREAMRGWPSGVAVVTSIHNGRIHGMTVNSLTSVSLDPPLVTVTLANQTRTCDLVTASGVFAVTLLEAGQAHISDIFSGKIPEERDRFDGLETETLVTGAPLLKGGRAYLDCQVVQSITLPKSTLFLGEVKAARGDLSRLPLLYLNREYRKVCYE
jgi:flavin reductase (DIM6/NTAB) family NADH-FMN oxidoreductase RutF